MIVVKYETFLRRGYSVVCKNTSWKEKKKAVKLSCKVIVKRIRAFGDWCFLRSSGGWIHVCKTELSPHDSHYLRKNCTATLMAAPQMCSSAFAGWTWLVTSVLLAAINNCWKGCYWKPWDNRDERDKRLLSQLRIAAILKGVPCRAAEMGTYQKLCRHNWQQEMKQFNDAKGLYR